MEYELFCEKLGIDPSKTTEIGKLFGSKPQRVNNWRLRGNVPARYVLEAHDRNLFTNDKPHKKAS